MTIYVDNAFIPFGRMKMCHMLASSLEELHSMADAIGIRREWFQDKRIPHYDVSMQMRKKAIEKGAIEIDAYEGLPKDIVRKTK